MPDPLYRSLDGRRVLVVEDEYMIADDLKQALAALGSEVIGPASSVADALSLLDANEVELAILDVNLGGEPAWPVADALASRRVPFVFTTGYDRAALPERYAHVPRCEKPVDMQRVSQALTRI